MTSPGRAVLKVLLLGDSSAGKTSLLNRFIEREFSGQYKATIGSDFSSKQVDIDGKFVTLQLWNTAGQERFQNLGPTFYRGTHCCVLVYDITKSGTFEAVEKWRREFSEQLGLSDADDFPFLLVGNNADLPDRAVEASTAREYAEMNRMLFYEVSAKTGDNVGTAFEAIVRKALERSPSGEWTIPASVLAQERNPEATSGGCDI